MGRLPLLIPIALTVVWAGCESLLPFPRPVTSRATVYEPVPFPVPMFTRVGEVGLSGAVVNLEKFEQGQVQFLVSPVRSFGAFVVGTTGEATRTSGTEVEAGGVYYTRLNTRIRVEVLGGWGRSEVDARGLKGTIERFFGQLDLGRPTCFDVQAPGCGVGGLSIRVAHVRAKDLIDSDEGTALRDAEGVFIQPAVFGRARLIGPLDGEFRAGLSFRLGEDDANAFGDYEASPFFAGIGLHLQADRLWRRSEPSAH